MLPIILEIQGVSMPVRHCGPGTLPCRLNLQYFPFQKPNVKPKSLKFSFDEPVTSLFLSVLRASAVQFFGIVFQGIPPSYG